MAATAPETAGRKPAPGGRGQGQRRQGVENKQEKGRGGRGAKNQKARNARPKTQKNPGGQERYNADGPGGAGSNRNKDGNQDNRRNNGRRRGDGKFGRRLRQPQKAGGRKSNEPSPAGAHPSPAGRVNGENGGPPNLRLPPSSSPNLAPWSGNRRQGQNQRGAQQDRKPAQQSTGNPRLDQRANKGGQSQAQDWTAQPEGLTDLGRKKYSVPWLLERRDNEKAKEFAGALPEELDMANLSPTARTRRYPFKSARPPPRHKGGRGEEVPAWMGDDPEAIEKDFNFKVLEEGDREHFLKFGRAKNKDDLKVISTAEHEATQQAKIDAEKKAHQEEFLKPVNAADILNAFSSEKMDNTDDFNPDSMFSAEAPAPPKKPEPKPKMVIHEIVMDTGKRPPPPRAQAQMPQAQAQAKPQPRDQGNSFLQSFMKKPNVNLPPEQGARLGSKRDPPGPPGHPLAADRTVRSSGQAPRDAGQMNQRQPMGARAAPQASNAHPRNENLAAKLNLMSIHPNQLAYASRSATKAIQDTLTKLGYKCIVQEKKPPEEMTEKERLHEQIKKTYEDAILRANKIFYSQKYMRRQQQKPRPVPSSQQRGA